MNLVPAPDVCESTAAPSALVSTLHAVPDGEPVRIELVYYDTSFGWTGQDISSTPFSSDSVWLDSMGRFIIPSDDSSLVLG